MKRPVASIASFPRRNPAAFDRLPFNKPVAFLLLALAWIVPAVATAQSSTVRLAVNKKRIVTGRPPVLILPPITSAALPAAGFTPISDYGSRTVYEGPAAAAPG